MVTRPRHALITGGSRGIGLAIAQLFAKKAYRCTLISRSEEDLKAAVRTLQPLPSSQAVEGSSSTAPSSSHSDSTEQENTLQPLSHGYIPGNISHASNFWTTNSSKSSHFGTYLPKSRIRQEDQASRIDVLVNCAGVSQAKLFTAMDDASIDKIINTNLTSMLIGTRFLLRNGYFGGVRRSSKAKDETESNAANEEELSSPVIINVASLLGLQGGYGAVAYAASKAGVLGFTRALANEYASHHVRVNAIVPGYVETEMTKDLNTSELEQRIPLGRFGKPEEIAQAALFLAENQYAHNCVMNIDGGLSAV